jgi:hypothetical protein
VDTATESAAIGDVRRPTSPAFSRARPGSVQGEQTGPSTGASVLLDIGGGNGALVVYGSDGLAGEEIEIRPHGGTWSGVHTAVRARHVGDRVLHAGVFGSLPAGLYDLRLRPTAADGGADHGHHSHASPARATGAAVTTVAVAPGAVAETTVAGAGDRP